MANYRFTPEQKKYAEDVAAKQPAFDSKVEALEDLKRRHKNGEPRELWQEPNGGKYLVAGPQAYEMLYRLDYNRILDTTEVFKMMSQDEIEEV